MKRKRNRIRITGRVVPLETTRHHRKVDRILGLEDWVCAESAEKQRRFQEHQIRERAAREAKAARRAAHSLNQGSHTHKYKVLRTCEDGVHRVVVCSCGDYQLQEIPGV